jgi:hypothetical protein
LEPAGDFGYFNTIGEKSMKIFPIVAIIVSLCISCPCNTDTVAREYEVYSSALPVLYPSTKQFVIEEQSSAYLYDLVYLSSMVKIGNHFKKSMPEVTPVMISGYRSANDQRSNFSYGFKIQNYTLVRSEEMDQLFKMNGGHWERFFKRYPASNGLITLSRVGFNEDATRAIFYMGMGCGNDCGEGSFVYMVKEGDSWRVDRKLRVW